MNPRRVHELMRERFPSYNQAELDWQVLCRGTEGDRMQVHQYLLRHFSEHEVLVEVTRKSGGLYEIEEAAGIIAQANGLAEIRIANRSFTSFAVVGLPGVAAAWHAKVAHSS
jgi:hypothetical protein